MSALGRKYSAGMAQQVAGTSQRQKMSSGVGAARKLMASQATETVSAAIPCHRRREGGNMLES